MTEKDHFGRPIPKSIAMVGMGLSRVDYGFHATSAGSWRAVADEVWAINKMRGMVGEATNYKFSNWKNVTIEIERLIGKDPS